MPARGRLDYLAVVADIVGSRDLKNRRPLTQKHFRELVAKLNKVYVQSLAAPFVISRGDEFQGLLNDAARIPDIVWNLESWFPDTELHLGFGNGTLDTPLISGGSVVELDGPAFHNAREAVERKARFGGTFRGFSEGGDAILNGFAAELRRHRERLSDRQKQVVELLRHGLNQTAVAQKLRLTKQAISDHVRAAGWDAYSEAENGWQAALVHFFRRPSTAKMVRP
jgi:hypothetical protein